MFDSLFGLVSYDLGIDLGTTHTFVLIKGKGIMIREPSVVARQQKSKQILAIGEEAKKMLGKTPKNIEAFYPLRNGVIADFDATQAMLEYYIRKVHETPGWIPKIPKPKVVIGVPSGVTEVERRAVQEAALSAGARRAYLIEEPMAAAIGIGLPINDPSGIFICDIGGGTSEIAIISLGGIVINRSVRVAGTEMDEAIVNFCRLKYSLLIGLPTAEEVKITLGSVYPKKEETQAVVRGRDLGTGLPRSVRISSSEIREALSPIASQIVSHIHDVLEETPPELVSDIINRGLILCGGTSQIDGFDKLVAEATKMPVWVADDPATAVVKGCGKVLENTKLLERVKITGGLK
ncbi:rod shape-determining protein [Candidatus Shapirobacteria bacterium CG08_land_8_20_14_0_20_39_18]|uniref:Cell shape-determining protein MreB n=1 Tax=Candidatus Shapirobacteria bacterium CG08_land_8_20_14_0_20_39_18 TaxID=1974883 RepID=A0A2M6XDC2_9BACT|nr:MAG: rod shape-determining protein [Candidatus Shapirobacteria bacterium CG08_land_8_20_14_0_20_39_18]PIY66022.1 MAG: rod shape-determining protein [Candidatus Shapirobacteria bacterium CG_4_10_14_0_8_um_filter_39_15]PJE67871.1 MAG: rod shape-determining protein [Candidatus Shapirobacteria bacterium CG10_big_fil_rev_8_21_14_0_10_38_8]